MDGSMKKKSNINASLVPVIEKKSQAGRLEEWLKRIKFFSLMIIYL
jgi:hypothetical protein